MTTKTTKTTETIQTFLITGLGNPGKGYARNRHNIGFMLVSELAEKLGLTFSRMQANALVTDGRHEGHKVILAKPQTFMNNSGQAVGSLASFYKIPMQNLLVVYDEADLPPGTIRMRPEGGSGGHQGMKSIIQRLGGQDFPRMRLGIGRPPGRMETPAYVLQDFSAQEEELLSLTLSRGVEAVLAFITEGIDAAMNRYNAQEE